MNFMLKVEQQSYGGLGHKEHTENALRVVRFCLLIVYEVLIYLVIVYYSLFVYYFVRGKSSRVVAVVAFPFFSLLLFIVYIGLVYLFPFSCVFFFEHYISKTNLIIIPVYLCKKNLTRKRKGLINSTFCFSLCICYYTFI